MIATKFTCGRRKREPKQNTQRCPQRKQSHLRVAVKTGEKLCWLHFAGEYKITMGRLGGARVA